MELLLTLPPWYQYTLVALFGLIIGSFLNVYLYRFNTGKSLAGSSHCLSCGKPLRWYELFPVLSYLALRGRCGGCESRIPLRYTAVELFTALLFLLAYYSVGATIQLPLLLLLVSILMVITVYDLYHLIIPDKLVAALILVIGALFIVSYGQVYSLTDIAYHALAAVGTFIFFGGLWWFSAGRWIGFGDVKLATPLAFFLGPIPAFSFIVLSFWIGAIISLGLLGVQYGLKRGKRTLSRSSIPLTMKSEVPFAPFIILAFLAVLFFNIDVLKIITLGYL